MPAPAGAICALQIGPERPNDRSLAVRQMNSTTSNSNAACCSCMVSGCVEHGPKPEVSHGIVTPREPWPLHVHVDSKDQYSTARISGAGGAPLPVAGPPNVGPITEKDPTLARCCSLMGSTLEDQRHSSGVVLSCTELRSSLGRHDLNGRIAQEQRHLPRSSRGFLGYHDPFDHLTPDGSQNPRNRRGTGTHSRVHPLNRFSALDVSVIVDAGKRATHRRDRIYCGILQISRGY